MAEYVFKVNGITRSTTEDKPLLRYLRDDLNLKSVKDGCSEGACGTCTIIVDGRAVKSCVLTTKKAVGRSIVTVEGLTHDEQEAFVYAFGKVGAVQCGFCIPGMVMAGKALIDKVPDPSEDQIKVALRGNICRCTGYKKIIEGITLAAAILRGDAEIDPELERATSSASVSVPSAPTCARRSSATASTATTSRWRAWSTAARCAPSTPGPAYWT